ncbi:MAG: hypothetical protein SPL07_07190 [Bacteroidales bacterium]|nr:hypothetical protein [Bacteroidales bacterium]
MNEKLVAQLNKTLRVKITLATLKEVFAYLFALRATGAINMLAGAQYLEKEFSFNHRDAVSILIFWTKNFKKVTQSEG